MVHGERTCMYLLQGLSAGNFARENSSVVIRISVLIFETRAGLWCVCVMLRNFGTMCAYIHVNIYVKVCMRAYVRKYKKPGTYTVSIHEHTRVHTLLQQIYFLFMNFCMVTCVFFVHLETHVGMCSRIYVSQRT
jgi:hypothetical protein